MSRKQQCAHDRWIIDIASTISMTQATGALAFEMRAGILLLLFSLVRYSHVYLELELTPLTASAWNGYNMARGTCTLHSFNENIEDEGEPPLGHSVNDVLKEQPEVYHNSTYGME